MVGPQVVSGQELASTDNKMKHYQGVETEPHAISLTAKGGEEGGSLSSIMGLGDSANSTDNESPKESLKLLG